MGWIPDQQGWLSYIKFELRYNEIDRARAIFERLVAASSWIRFAKFELKNGNVRRARNCYERATDEKMGDDEEAEQIYYSLYEEVDAEDIERTREVYRECLQLILHNKFSFAKVWLLAAQFEIRQMKIKDARKILGNAIGISPKDKVLLLLSIIIDLKIFKKCIEIELQLANISRCRTLYEKYLKWVPQNCYAWIKYAELERSLNEQDRARAIFDIAIAQPALDMPGKL
ncbi:hypothetical protein GIB67_007067 [Kingdonia uniflora]|uniref:Crooked neck protein n=1 Tax=Kingdonia uniflora TaxID=39325 RepID=A0A7J7NKG8_9MAGN|nr:hypothetical protein GIB67_001950 [Kingdonia uniflora]KAF6172554.1 hypothetical protein GIB67_007067 [Kingdonia uniflora]